MLRGRRARGWQEGGLMRAVLVEEYGVVARLVDVPAPVAAPGGVVLKVEATGLCRSDWHGWRGHDPDIRLPHVPGHELAGRVAQVGPGVDGWVVGDRVTVPFICACGQCVQCRAGDQQVCPNQEQPGFTYWGSFAEYVAVPYAAVNLVRLPEETEFDTAAALGCRFATAYRGITQVGRLARDEWLVVYGCGGVGLSAVMVAAARGARVVAVDTSPQALAVAGRFGAERLLQAGPDVPGLVHELTGGGASVTVDAIGAASVVQQALQSLRPRGRHVQLGLLPGEVRLDMSALIGRELQWLGSHGMAAHAYPEMLALVESGAVRPAELVTSVIGLEDVPAALAAMDDASPTGITVIHP
jgi:D-arabinose 1-dehydrogenase-like Zn-dependent alcohol dehydrogenase